MDNIEVMKLHEEDEGADGVQAVSRGLRFWCKKKKKMVDGTGCNGKSCALCGDAEDKPPKPGED